MTFTRKHHRFGVKARKSAYHILLVALPLFVGGVARADLSAKEERAIVPLYMRNGHNIGTGFWSGGSLHTAGHVAAYAPLYIRDGNTYREIKFSYSEQNYYDYARGKVAGYKPPVSLKWGRDLCDDQSIRLYGYRLNEFQKRDGYVQDSVYRLPTGVMGSTEVVGRAAIGTCQSKSGNSGGPIINRQTNEVVGIVTHSNPWGKVVFLRCDMVPR